MKTKRLTKVIAVILALSMLPIALIGCGGGQLGTISERLVEMMVGDGKVDDDNKYTEAYIKRIDAEVEYIDMYFVDQGYWNDKYIPQGSTAIAQYYQNCYKLAVAWSTKGSDYYHSRSVLKMIKTTLDYVYTNLYGEEQKLSSDGHLTMQERCDQAEYLIRTLLILDDAGKLSNSNIENYASVVSAKFPVPMGNGADLIRTTYIVAAYSALLGDDTKMENIVTEWMPKVCATVASGNGIYTDGSFVANTNVASTGSYGVIAFSCLSELVYALSGTDDYKIKKDVGVADFLYNWAVNSIVPSLYNGRAFTATVSGYLYNADILGGRAVSAILALADFYEDQDLDAKAKELRGIVKGYGKADDYFVAYLTTHGVDRYEDLADDKDVKAVTLEGTKLFARNDKLAVRGPQFSASLSLSSVRTAKYETNADYRSDGVDEAVGGKYWYTGDGMFTLYTTKYSPDANYWAYVNAKRIPGTTVDNGLRNPTNSGGYSAIRQAAGAAIVGNYSIASLDFLSNMNDLRSDLVAKKSWFIFDGEIVALGAGIKNTTVDATNQLQTIETVIENVFYKDYKSVTVGPDLSSDDSKWTLIDNKEVDSPYNAIYVSTYGGILVPNSSYNANNVFKCALKITAGGNYVEMWLDHGNYESDTPAVIEGETYEYCILPGTVVDSKQFFDYAAAPGYTVLANTESVQAVTDASSGATGIAFWEAGATVEGYTAGFACNMMVVEKDGKVTISVADIRQNAALDADANQIVLPFNVASVVNAATGITASGNVITVDRAVAANGQSLVIELTK